jgi:triosephosphate isomerase
VSEFNMDDFEDAPPPLIATHEEILDAVLDLLDAWETLVISFEPVKHISEGMAARHETLTLVTETLRETVQMAAFGRTNVVRSEF